MVAVEGRLGEEGVCKGGGSESRQPRAPGRCGLRDGGGGRVWIKVLPRGPEPTPMAIHLLILIDTTTQRTHKDQLEGTSWKTLLIVNIFANLTTAAIFTHAHTYTLHTHASFNVGPWPSLEMSIDTMGIVYTVVPKKKKDSKKESKEEEGELVGEHRGFAVISKTGGDCPVLFVCVKRSD